MCQYGRKPLLSEVDATTMRRFILVRERDVSGVSGTGIVADGVEFPGGEIALRWRNGKSIAVFRSLKAVQEVHSHKGNTEVVILDEWPERGDPRIDMRTFGMAESEYLDG